MTTPAFIVVIPARYQSSRLPGKMLLDIAGKPMILHVVERARQSRASAVYVATDDDRIRSVCEAAGARVCMTDPAHQSGTDRIAEVAAILPDAAERTAHALAKDGIKHPVVADLVEGIRSNTQKCVKLLQKTT